MRKVLTLIFAAVLVAACSDDDKDYVFEVDWQTRDFIAFGTTTQYGIIRSGYDNISVSAPEGWTVTVSADKVSITAPAGDLTGAETSGKVTLSSGEAGENFSVSMDVYTGIIAGFEDVPQEILAVDAKGSNFYAEYDGVSYTGYTDEYSGLTFTVNQAYDDFNFYNGGTFFSTWNEDLENGIWENQCTVNYRDPETGYGGHNGSKVFGLVHYSSYLGIPTTISFGGQTGHVIDHIWITNTFYTFYVVENGNYLSDPSVISENNGFLYLTATGYNADGVKTSSADFYLADYRTADSPGLIREWTKFDLSSLGEVNRVEFTMDGSDSDPDYGLNTPAYFCFDDIAIRY